MKRRLAAYRAKRDFRRTPEPHREQAAAGPFPRFVIQKHAARRLHYDLRLEIDGVFRSWAVTRGISLAPGEKRLAVEVEDHPLAYGDFEGTIPKGAYGGGTVMIWDRGYWAPVDGKDPARALAAGELKVALAGKKLRGVWVLVRLARQENSGRSNWLLIRHRPRPGERFQAGAPDDVHSVASGRTMDEITAGRAPPPEPFIEPPTGRHPPGRPGRAASASGMPRFVSPALCRAIAEPPSGEGWLHEVKLDGYRVQLRVEGGTVELRARSGRDMTVKLPAMVKAAQRLPDCIIDGELVVLDADGVSSFSALQEALATEDQKAFVYFAFDLLFERGEDLRALPLIERKRRLQALMAGLPAASSRKLRYLDHVREPGREVLQSACRIRLEGIISKRADATYRSGRHEDWTKAKCRLRQDVVIGGWSDHRGALRSLLVGVPGDGGLGYAGRVGTGFKAAAARDVLARLKTLECDRSPFVGAGAPRRTADVHWVAPELSAEIEFASWTRDDLVRQASFQRLLPHKPGSGRQAPRATPVKRERVRPAGRVAVTRPHKLLWPATPTAPAVSKLDLAGYIDAVGDWMIRHLAGRPCSLVRAPDGIGGEIWFQRHAGPGVPESVGRIKVSGDHKPYLQLDTVEHLAAMAQLGAVEFHPWNCAPGQPQVPGRLVFDLDPGPDVAFDDVVRAAKALRRHLEAAGLVPFCKTTGGKGLHVVVPLRAGGDTLTWDDAKEFARLICLQVAREDPDRYVVTMKKARRHGRIFLDYFRNDRTATAVAPLSPRARPGAPVSMPLTWGQVRAGLDPGRYTIQSVPRLLARSTAWRGYEASARPLIEAIRRAATAGG